MVFFALRLDANINRSYVTAFKRHSIKMPVEVDQTAALEDCRISELYPPVIATTPDVRRYREGGISGNVTEFSRTAKSH